MTSLSSYFLMNESYVSGYRRSKQEHMRCPEYRDGSAMVTVLIRHTEGRDRRITRSRPCIQKNRVGVKVSGRILTYHVQSHEFNSQKHTHTQGCIVGELGPELTCMHSLDAHLSPRISAPNSAVAEVPGTYKANPS